MSDFINLTGSNVVVWSDGYPATLPPGTTTWRPSGDLSISNGVENTFPGPFSVFHVVTLEGQNGVVERIHLQDYKTEFFAGFGLVVACGLAVAAVRLASRGLQHGNFTGDL